MIPIGTRCIVIGAIFHPEIIGEIFTIADYSRAGFPTNQGTSPQYRAEEAHPVTGNGWCCDGRFLVPIGHDPDTETRTTDREVTA